MTFYKINATNFHEVNLPNSKHITILAPRCLSHNTVNTNQLPN